MNKTTWIWGLCMVWTLGLSAQEDLEKPTQQIPNRLLENVELEGYEVIQTVRIDTATYLLVGNRLADETPRGLRILFLLQKEERYKIRYRSVGYGESSIADPWVFRFENGDRIVLCEIGDSYSWGVEAFLITLQEVRYLGLLDIAAGPGDPRNVIPRMQIRRHRQSGQITFSFSGLVVLNPGGEAQQEMAGKRVIYVFEDELQLLIQGL